MCMPCTSFVDALRKECAELHLFFGIMDCMKATLKLILGQLFKKNVILLEFYKQEFKQGWFMLLLHFTMKRQHTDHQKSNSAFAS